MAAVSLSDSPNLLSRALNLAEDPNGSDEALISAACDLVAWGAFDQAREVIATLEQRGVFKEDTRRLRRSIEHFSDLGPEFEQQFLVNAVQTVNDPAATSTALIAAADSLLKWGALDEADIAIARLEQNEQTRPDAAALKAASRQLRRSGVLSTFSAVGYPETAALNRPYEALVARGNESADKVVIVFTGAERKFWLSLHVLYHYLRKLNAHVIYLNDHSSTLFLNGLESLGGGYPGLLAKITELIGDLGVRRVCVMASSAGGFIGLRTAADIGADSYLGLGIRTSLAGNDRLPLAKYEKSAASRCRDKNLLVNMRTYLAGRDTPHRVTLFAGDHVKFDVVHAENLRGLPNVELFYLPQYRRHNVVPGLIARGQFEDVLQRFVSPVTANATG